MENISFNDKLKIFKQNCLLQLHVDNSERLKRSSDLLQIQLDELYKLGLSDNFLNNPNFSTLLFTLFDMRSKILTKLEALKETINECNNESIKLNDELKLKYAIDTVEDSTA